MLSWLSPPDRISIAQALAPGCDGHHKMAVLPMRRRAAPATSRWADTHARETDRQPGRNCERAASEGRRIDLSQNSLSQLRDIGALRPLKRAHRCCRLSEWRAPPFYTTARSADWPFPFRAPRLIWFRVRLVFGGLPVIHRSPTVAGDGVHGASPELS